MTSDFSDVVCWYPSTFPLTICTPKPSIFFSLDDEFIPHSNSQFRCRIIVPGDPGGTAGIELTGYDDYRPLAIFLRDNAGAIIAGLTAFTGEERCIFSPFLCGKISFKMIQGVLDVPCLNATVQEKEEGMSEHNKALIRRFYDAWNERKMDEVVSMIAPNYIDHAMPPEMAYGREGFLKARALGKQALADVHLQLEHIFAENDYIIAHVIVHATHVGTYKSIPPTGKRFAMETISIMRLENDQLIEHWECNDFSDVMKQLGATIILENKV